MIQNAENQNRQDRTDAGKRDQTEALVIVAVSVAQLGKALSKSHDEGNRDRPRCDAARVERRRYEIGRDEESQQDQDRVQDQKHR